MNITSYNVTDVTYHYIGLRVLARLPETEGRDTQIAEISRNILKFVTDKSLRLMLPQPRGTFQGTGEKVCQELVHFRFARSSGGRYALTEDGYAALSLLESRDFTALRRLMAQVHLQTYDNLRDIVRAHIEAHAVWRPIVEPGRKLDDAYLRNLLKPTFGDNLVDEVALLAGETAGLSAGKVQDALQAKVIRNLVPAQRVNVANFRAICDRLVSLRLLNERRVKQDGSEFILSYSPCKLTEPQRFWYFPMDIALKGSDSFRLFFCEPDMKDQHQQDVLLESIDEALGRLQREGGYYDIPDLRDQVCQALMIPETTFDEGINCLLDREPPVLVAGGIQYDRITARRRPLVRQRRDVELHNLIRRT